MAACRACVLSVVAAMMFSTGVLHAAPLFKADGKAASKAAPKAEAKKAAPKEEAEPAAEGGGKVWFSFFGDDYKKPILQDRGMLIDLVAFFFFEVGGALWGPMLLAGASWDSEWVVPSLVYLAACWAFSIGAILLCWTGVGLLLFIPAALAAWIGTEVTLANLDRPEVKLKGDDEAASEK